MKTLKEMLADKEVKKECMEFISSLGDRKIVYVKLYKLSYPYNIVDKTDVTYDILVCDEENKPISPSRGQGLFMLTSALWRALETLKKIREEGEDYDIS